MTIGYEPLAALGRAHLGYCEQLAGFMLESLERTHRMNMDAFKAFWERRFVETKLAVENGSPAMLGDSTATAFFEHWTRANETASYLCQEFGRLAADYANDVKNAVPAASDTARSSNGPVRAERAKAPRALEGSSAKAA